MAIATNDAVISEALWKAEGNQIWIKRAILVVFGVLLMAVCAKIKFFLPNNPAVPVNLGTLAVLGIGAAYGPRLGVITVLAYMVVGLLGFNIFANSSAENYGWAYMSGGTGGYLVGYVLAALALGFFARLGWDRNVFLMAVAMLVGNALIYVPGIAWLYVLVDGGWFDAAKFSTPWAQTITWGFMPFLIGDVLKLAIAAIALPVAWKLIGNART